MNNMIDFVNSLPNGTILLMIPHRDKGNFIAESPLLYLPIRACL
jgi:hypothetical protein